MAKEIERWVTINGKRVPIYEDGSMGGFMEGKAISRKAKSPKKKESIPETDAVLNARHAMALEAQRPGGPNEEAMRQLKAEYDRAVEEAKSQNKPKKDSANKTDEDFMEKENERWKKEFGNEDAYQWEDKELEKRGQEGNKNREYFEQAKKEGRVDKDAEYEDFVSYAPIKDDPNYTKKRIERETADENDAYDRAHKEGRYTENNDVHYDTKLNDIRERMRKGEITAEQAKDEAFDYEKSQRGNKKWNDQDRNNMESKVRDIFDEADERSRRLEKKERVLKEIEENAARVHEEAKNISDDVIDPTKWEKPGKKESAGGSFEADLEEHSDPEYKNVTKGVKTERQAAADKETAKSNTSGRTRVAENDNGYYITKEPSGMGDHYSLYYQHPGSGSDGLTYLGDAYGSIDKLESKLGQSVLSNKGVQDVLNQARGGNKDALTKASEAITSPEAAEGLRKLQERKGSKSIKIGNKEVGVSKTPKSNLSISSISSMSTSKLEALLKDKSSLTGQQISAINEILKKRRDDEDLYRQSRRW